MKTYFTILIVFFLFIISCKKEDKLTTAQSEFFIKYFGNSSYNESGDIKQTSDGGFIIIGTSGDGTSADISLIKTDAWGNKEWSKSFGSSGEDVGKSVQLTSDGGYILLGTFSKSLTDNDMYLIKTDAMGKESWNTKIGGIANQEGACVQLTADGGYILAGSTLTNNPGATRDIFYVKTNDKGDSLWSNTMTNSFLDYATYIRQRADGGYVLIGSSQKNTPKGTDIIVVETDETGSITGFSLFGGNSEDIGESFQILADGSYLIIGSTSSFGNNASDIYLVKVKRSGDSFSTVWSKTFGGSLEDKGKNIMSTSDNGFIIIGSTKSMGNGESDQYLIKISADATEQWSKTFGGVGNDEGNAIVQTTDGGYAILGATQLGGNPMISLIKTNSSGGLK